MYAIPKSGKTNSNFTFVNLETMKELSNINILHLEDNLADQVIFQEHLSYTTYASSEVTVVESIQQLSSLQEEQYQPELVVVDLNLPDSEGTHTLDMVRKYYPSLPLIVLTGAYSQDFGVDYVPSPNQRTLLKRFQNVASLEQAIYSVTQSTHKTLDDSPQKVIDPYDLLLANLELDTAKHPQIKGKTKETYKEGQEASFESRVDFDYSLLIDIEFDITQITNETEILELFESNSIIQQKAKEIFRRKSTTQRT
ncbi:hypothetical protein BKI52_29645 [marine bacterium AO1-C]|nr:hypothetical protein BKI52_29645 [marine bacterium AO1-C]